MLKERLTSLDVFRGFTILLMTMVNNPGSWSSVYPQLEHATWNGCTFADLVFPFFVFIVGAAIPFAMPEKTFDSATFTKILIRSLRIICLGLTLNFFSWINIFDLEGIPSLLFKSAFSLIMCYALMGNFSLKTKKYLVFAILAFYLTLSLSGLEGYQTTRLPGVLQRIGIVYFFTSLIYLKTNYKIQIAIATIILLGYWAVMTLIPVPGIGVAILEIGTNFASWLDSIVLKNHMYIETKTWDPEGFLSTLPTIGGCLIGSLIGQIINTNLTKIEIAKKLIAIGVILTIIGYVWDFVFPINKSIWTSSFVVYTAGLGTITLTILYYIIDIANFKKWTKPFLFWGVNPMLVFFFSGLIPRIMSKIKFDNTEIIGEQINIQTYIYNNGIAHFFSNPYNASFVGSLVYIVIWTFILWIFYKNKLIFKV